MEIIVEIKPGYTILTPQEGLLDNQAQILTEKIKEQQQSGSKNFIISMKNCTDIDSTSAYALLELHHSIYEHTGSLAFCELNNVVLQKLKQEQLHLSLNLTPTFIEAVDIVNMEMLERELYND
jgi:anti-anti-sigma regulatory factor